MKGRAFLFGLIILAGCTPDAPTPAFNVILNGVQQESGRMVIDLDYTDALDSGFVIPSKRQVREGRFSFRCSAQVKKEQGDGMRYKLYYVNDSYRFAHAGPDSAQHPLAQENFYGSWELAAEGFRRAAASADGHVLIEDDFRIRGDPRDEPEHRDADGKLARWSRNPRVGEYRFMLVLIPEAHFQRSPPPAAVVDISRKADGQFVDPFWYWLYGPGARDPQVQVHIAEERLSVRARPDLGAGIYIRSEVEVDPVAFSDQCGNSPILQQKAPFEQFIHYVDPSTRFANIPLIADVLANEFTPADHDRYRCLYLEDEMVVVRPKTTGTPCATVSSDPVRHSLELRNPASIEGHWGKENVGVRSRHAFSYGKYRVKCRLTRLLNDSDMWVGITNAIWLLYDGAPDSLRRVCENGGYLRNYYGGSGDERVPRVAYSEIDFEILKTSPYCPSRTFPPTFPQTMALPNDRSAWAYSTSDARTDGPGMITVACTNWDMACRSPENFGHGCRPIEHNGKTFTNHRWDENYRAVTQKSEASDQELFGGPYYWFEIDWRPEEIIWRIGPELDRMREVGYMDRSVTEISNVQMQLVITQEFHNTRWWPGTPYEQGFVPFPAKDLVGEILEVSIE